MLCFFSCPNLILNIGNPNYLEMHIAYSDFPLSPLLITIEDISMFQLRQLKVSLNTDWEYCTSYPRRWGIENYLWPALHWLSFKRKGRDFDTAVRLYFYRSRIYVPSKLRTAIWNELHFGHVGVVKMKALARSYVYFPKQWCGGYGGKLSLVHWNPKGTEQ